MFDSIHSKYGILQSASGIVIIAPRATLVNLFFQDDGNSISFVTPAYLRYQTLRRDITQKRNELRLIQQSRKTRNNSLQMKGLGGTLNLNTAMPLSIKETHELARLTDADYYDEDEDDEDEISYYAEYVLKAIIEDEKKDYAQQSLLESRFEELLNEIRCLQHIIWKRILFVVSSYLIIDAIRLSFNISEYPNRIRPPCTTMPWSIWPALVVLWGVCWMFYDNDFTLDDFLSGDGILDVSQASFNIDTLDFEAMPPTTPVQHGSGQPVSDMDRIEAPTLTSLGFSDAVAQTATETEPAINTDAATYFQMGIDPQPTMNPQPPIYRPFQMEIPHPTVMGLQRATIPQTPTHPIPMGIPHPTAMSTQRAAIPQMASHPIQMGVPHPMAVGLQAAANTQAPAYAYPPIQTGFQVQMTMGLQPAPNTQMPAYPPIQMGIQVQMTMGLPMAQGVPQPTHFNRNSHNAANRGYLSNFFTANRSGVFMCRHQGCDASFARSDHCIRHERTHKSPRYRCKFPNCTSVYNRADNLAQHVQRENHYV